MSIPISSDMIVFEDDPTFHMTILVTDETYIGVNQFEVYLAIVDINGIPRFVQRDPFELTVTRC